MSEPPVAEALFAERVDALPWLGLGVSTEFGAHDHGAGLDLLALREKHPNWAGFLEVGVDLERGLDTVARSWSAQRWPTTYHFLDINLEDGSAPDPRWVDGARSHAKTLGAHWFCGDAGLWHLGARDRGHSTLMPPILTDASAEQMAHRVRALRSATGREVLPENPPAHVFVGELGLLDYFARVGDLADCGLLLDVAHLAIYQLRLGRTVTEGLDSFPLERVVEIHIAGGTPFRHQGHRFIDDDHGPEPLPEAWEILRYVLPRAERLRALVYECERNPLEAVAPNFERLEALLSETPR